MIVLLLMLIAFVFAGTGSGESTARAVPATQVPDVTGLASTSAERRVRQAGLVPVKTQCRTPVHAYDVKSQRPAGGTTVPRGTRVRLQLMPAQGHTPCNAYSGVRP